MHRNLINSTQPNEIQVQLCTVINKFSYAQVPLTLYQCHTIIDRHAQTFAIADTPADTQVDLCSSTLTGIRIIQIRLIWPTPELVLCRARPRMV